MNQELLQRIADLAWAGIHPQPSKYRVLIGEQLPKVDDSACREIYRILRNELGLVADPASLPAHASATPEKDRRSTTSWQPIATAPLDEVCWFWVRPKRPDESYIDTSGHSIFTRSEPHAWVGKYKCWSALETADFWMPYWTPAPPE